MKTDKTRGGTFYFCISLPSGASLQRPAAVKGAPLFRRGGADPLDGEDRCESLGEGGKDLGLKDARSR
jgi:hypothetical protein